MAVNPYHKWLGLDPKIKNPHHFQLLGVSSKIDDANDFQQQVVAAAKTRLAQLNKIDAGADEALLEQLKKRIVQARNILSDDQKRAEYIIQLKTQIAAAKNSKSATSAKSATSSRTQATAKSQPASIGKHANPKQAAGKPSVQLVPNKDRLPPGAKPAEPTRPTRKKVSPAPTASNPAASQSTVLKSDNAKAAAATPNPQFDFLPPGFSVDSTVPIVGAAKVSTPIPSPVIVGNAPIIAVPCLPAIAQKPGIMQAIPMAVPLNAAGQPALAAGGVAVNSDGVPIDDVKIQKVKRKRKNSLLASIVFTLMLLAGIGGAIGIYFNFDTIMKLGGIDPEEVPSSPGIIAEEKTNPPNESVDPASDLEKTNELATVDVDSLPELNIDEVMQHPETLDATNRNTKSEKMRGEWLKGRLKEAGEVDPLATSVSNSADSPDTNSKPNITSKKPAKQLDQNQLAEFRKHMERARRSLKRREKATAQQEFGKAKLLFEGLLGDEFSLEPSQQKMQDLVDASNQAIELLDGFWAQVVTSSKNIAGGQEIKIGKQIVGFVEADDQQVIVRNAGSNIIYRYDHLPAGLSVALGNQGAIPDIPTWRLQQAVFYSLYVDEDADYADRVEELLMLSETDGHDGTSIRRFMTADLSNVGVPETKVGMPTEQEITDWLADFRGQHNISDLAPVKAEDASEFAQLLLEENPDSVDQRSAFLDQAREMGIHSGDAYLVEDAILELNVWAEIESADLQIESYLELAKQKLDPQQARRLLETAIPLLNLPTAKTTDERKKKQLINRLTKLANENGYVDSSRRLGQIK